MKYWAYIADIKTSILTLALTQIAIGIIFSIKSSSVASLVTIKKKGQELLSTQQLRWRSIVWHWPLNKRPENQLGSSTRTRCKHCSNINVRFKCWAEYSFEDQLFNLDPNINLGHLRTRNIRCIKLGNFQANGSKDISNDQQFDLTIRVCDLKSILVI